MWRPLAVLVAVLAANSFGSIGVAAAPASAAPGCGTAADAHWSSTAHYTYGRGHWCMTNGYSTVIYQSDGNLVWYDARGGQALWSSNTCYICSWTPNQGANNLYFQTDGNIVIRNSRGQTLWAIGNSPKRTSATNYYWRLSTSFLDCYVLHLTHLQVDPNPNYTMNLHSLTSYCGQPAE